MIYGYIRVSANHQDCENQKLGIEEKAKSFGLKIEKSRNEEKYQGFLKNINYLLVLIQ